METEVKACEFKAYVDEKTGTLVVEATSEECHQAAVEAASDKGVDVKHIKPAKVTEY